MRVRCGRCRSDLEVPGPGRHPCPVCGAVNEVRLPGDQADPSSAAPPPPPPPPDPPSPRISCDACGFGFIVGQVTEAPCPNCGATVTVPPPEGAE